MGDAPATMRLSPCHLMIVVLSCVHFSFVAAQAGSGCWRDTPCSPVTEAAFPGDWDASIYAPASRTVAPKFILSADTGEARARYQDDGPLRLEGNGSKVVFDFGTEVGGIVSVRYTVAGGDGEAPSGALGLAFTEAKDWIGEWSDASNGGFRGPDGALYSSFSGAGRVSYTMPDLSLRGGFRYLTCFLTLLPAASQDGAASVNIDRVSLEIGFQPTWRNLRAYGGYFYSDDELLNRVWYAGAYTLQTNIVPVRAGRRSPFVRVGWANDGVISNGTSVLVDGAKRDRAVWPGDMGVAVPAMFVSLGDLASVKNALQAVYDHQNADGSFPEAGPPLLQQNSDTYHMWTMVGTHTYVLYTDDNAFLERNWPAYLRAMAFIRSKVSAATNLLNVTGTRDWARLDPGGTLTSAQALLYHVLETGAELADWAAEKGEDPDAASLSVTWLLAADVLKRAAAELLWDEGAGAFRDKLEGPRGGSGMHPQDGNSLALLFGLLPDGDEAAQRISARLEQNWTPLGPEPPELPGHVSPFVSSLEVGAHLAAGRADRALEVVRRCWGWYLSHPNGTGSTVIEGFLTNGSFAYRWNRGYGLDGSYTSHSHGWGAGPTSALTEAVLGLRVVGRGGSRWRLEPGFSGGYGAGLGRMEGGFGTGLGRFRAGWDRTGVKNGTTAGGGARPEYSLWVGAPEDTVGEVVLPVVARGYWPRVEVNGTAVELRLGRVGMGEGVSDTVIFELAGGYHSIQVS